MKQKRKIFRKRISTLFLACLVGMQTLCTTAFAQTAYYADDNFRSISADAVSPVSAWDLDRSGGDIVASSTQGIVLNDTSRNASVKLSREIDEISSGEVSFEAVLNPIQRAEGICFGLGDGEENVAKS